MKLLIAYALGIGVSAPQVASSHASKQRVGHAHDADTTINDSSPSSFTQKTQYHESGIAASTIKPEPDVGILSHEQGTLGRRSAAECLDFVVCDNGMAGSETCEDACLGDCCNGTNACVNFSGTVCKDGVSCFGDRACYYAKVGAIVQGCHGHEACYYAAYGGGIISEIVNSCHGHRACYGAAKDGGTIGVMQDSCLGFKACDSAAYDGIIGNISSSCNGTETCHYATAFGGSIGGISNSCHDNNSCGFAAACSYVYCGSIITEISDSCDGVKSCYGAAYERGNIGSIQSSCQGNHTCYYAAAYGGSIAGIQDACNAYRACFYAGRGETSTISSEMKHCCNTPNECENITEATLPEECTQTNTTAPTTSPSNDPSATPSKTPTTAPTTYAPTFTYAPTAAPSKIDTDKPSMKPAVRGSSAGNRSKARKGDKAEKSSKTKKISKAGKSNKPMVNIKRLRKHVSDSTYKLSDQLPFTRSVNTAIFSKSDSEANQAHMKAETMTSFGKTHRKPKDPMAKFFKDSEVDSKSGKSKAEEVFSKATKKQGSTSGAKSSKATTARAEVERLIEESERELIPKFLRLGFHDCVGGCDGCVDLANPDNKGLSEPITEIAGIVDRFKETHSRADIWALATLVSADMSLTGERPEGIHFPMRFIGRKDCEGADAMGVGGPNVTMPSNDLTTHELLEFFSDEFDFSAEEVVTIMGAHAVAVATRENVGFGNVGREEGWVFEAEEYVLDNRYYDMLLGEDTNRFVSSAPMWQLELVRNEGDIPSRYQWFHEKEGEEERPIMTNADMALVRDLSGHMAMDEDGNTGKVDCVFKEGKEEEHASRRLNSDKPVVCPVASQTIEKALEYKLDNELFLYDFEAVLEKMISNGYEEHTNV